jgi:hypothetical protein
MKKGKKAPRVRGGGPRNKLTLTASQELTISQSTFSQVNKREDPPKEYQTWGSVAQYVIMQLAGATPYALLVWLAYLRH